MAFLTIDDAPSARFGEKLEYLRSRGIPATFFCEGRAVGGREEGLLRALELGYELGNHSYSHPYFGGLPIAECRSEIERTDALIAALYARAGRSWERKRFRFPYLDGGGGGAHAEELQSLLRSMGYEGPASQAGGWADTRCDFDQREYWLGKPDAPDGCSEREGILARIDACHPAAGDRILIHDHEYTHELFFECVDRYARNGLALEPLD